MNLTNCIRIGLVALVVVLVLPVAAWAQQSASVAGVARDDSGGVLPGVTVSAASPALIEGERIAFTDGQGRYNVVDLRPGTYTVTFTLPGFSTVVREELELTSGFTATINVELAIGALQETITVSGQTPLVDIQNVRQLNVVTSELLDMLPTTQKSMAMLANLTPGMIGNPDVGGSAGAYSQQAQIAGFRGKTNSNRFTFDGMTVNNMCGVQSISYIITGGMLEEMAVEIGGFTAESTTSSVLMNAIPKTGANVFSGNYSGMYANDSLQSSNVNDDLIARGLTSGFDINWIYHFEASLGGPIKQDKLWFYTAHRLTGNRNQAGGIFWNATQGTPFYTPDTARGPADQKETLRSNAVRLTWQANASNKFSGFVDVQHNRMPRHRRQRGFQAPEALNAWDFPPPAGLYQASWTATVSSRLLIEGGVSTMLQPWNVTTQDGVGPNDISIRELSTGFRYNAAGGSGPYGDRKTDRNSQRFSVSYVTGTHNFKVGVRTEQGLDERSSFHNGAPLTYDFRNGLPSRLTMYATPFPQDAEAYDLGKKIKLDMGLYAQDQWSVGRMTLNLGLRFDYLNGESRAKNVPATLFLPARSFDKIPDVPNWSDLSPRGGVAYDLRGDGRTALKVSFGKYVVGDNASISSSVNPLRTSVQSINRPWTDTNGDFTPDCNLLNPLANGECGPFSNPDFGGRRITTRFDDDIVTGFGVRDYLWDLAAEVQHELLPGLSVTTGYYRNWYSNFRVTDNLAVTSADFDPYCITAPVDSRLPGGGGYEVCGFHDITPEKFGQSDSFVTKASTFGDQTRRSDFFSLTTDARLPGGVQFGGGIDVGRTVTDSCFTIDEPNQSATLGSRESGQSPFGQWCRHVNPVKGNFQFKMHGSYPLPGGFAASVVFQSLSGPPISAQYSATTAEIEPSLGRPLAGGRRTVRVPLIEPFTLFEGRRNQIDLRVTKAFYLGPTQLRVNFDAYNAFNSAAILGSNPIFGPSWRRPQAVQTNSAILDARLIEFSVNMTF